MTGIPSDVLRLDEIIHAGIDGDPYTWLVAFGRERPYQVLAPNVADWVRLELLSSLDGWHRGRARLCIHRPSPLNTRDPVIAASRSASGGGASRYTMSCSSQTARPEAVEIS